MRYKMTTKEELKALEYYERMFSDEERKEVEVK